MRLSELIGLEVRTAEGETLGRVVDARLVLDGPPSGHGTGALAAPRLHGLLVSPRSRDSFLGYERTDVDRPALLARLLRRRQRGTALVLWRDVAAVGETIGLRPGAQRYSPQLPELPERETG
ncbi:MAG TPA: PRC-barrel domain-containing protein [Gryllotalpicola sp.]